MVASNRMSVPIKLEKGGQLKKRMRGEGRNYQRKLPEYLRLQGVPLDFFKYSPFTMQAKGEMLGNGVPLPMGRAIAKAVRLALEATPK